MEEILTEFSWTEVELKLKFVNLISCVLFRLHTVFSWQVLLFEHVQKTSSEHQSVSHDAITRPLKTNYTDLVTFLRTEMFRGWFRRRSFTCKHIVLCRHFTHVSFGQIHIRCCRRFVFNILTFLLRPNWPTTAALISPSITPQSVTLPQHAVCVQVWLFLHFRAEKSPFFEC